MRKFLSQWRIFGDRYYWLTAVLIARSNLSKQYRNSFLGIVWTLLQPLSMVLVYALIIPLITHFPFENYALYIICTLPLWSFISTTLVGSHISLLAQGETLKRCMVSSTVFPIADVFRNAYTYFIAFGCMYGAALVLGYPWSWYVLLWPIYFIPVLIAITSLSIGISYTSPYVRDIGDALTVLMNMMIWFSAVIYPISALPEWAQAIMAWNPFHILLAPVIELVYFQRLPDLLQTAQLAGVTSLAVMVGYFFFRICRRNYVYYL